MWTLREDSKKLTAGAEGDKENIRLYGGAERAWGEHEDDGRAEWAREEHVVAERNGIDTGNVLGYFFKGRFIDI